MKDHRASKIDFADLIDDARKQTETLAPSRSENLGLIRDYDLIRELHRGGQGVVYLAHHKNTHRDVAIKLLRQGPFAGAGERARFEREVHILASLKHPHIVTVHDSGSVADNDYFVMDYISGQSFDAWAENTRAQNNEDTRGGSTKTHTPSDGSTEGQTLKLRPFSPQQRILQVFVKICAAVNAAHLRGIIHRDLKPSNIRVDESNVPFVLDFGLAKRTNADSDDDASVTEAGQFLGTLRWASPEQVNPESCYADVRSDVYALGLVLYNALTGEFPYAMHANAAQMTQTILHGEPTRPRTLVRQMDVDLETILLTCLAKDADRRYQTAGLLSEDLQRYLRYEPIHARRDSGWYTLRMFARRHWLAVGAASMIALVLICSTVLLSLLYQRAVRGERRAIQQAQRTERVAEFQAAQLSNIDTAAMGLGLKEQILATTMNSSSSDDQEERGSLHDLLGGVNFTDIALQSIDQHVFANSQDSIERQFDREPLLQATLLQSLATSQRSMGLFDSARTNQESALEIRRDQLGDFDPTTLQSLAEYARLLKETGKLQQAETIFLELLNKRRQELGNRHLDTLATMSNLAELYQELDQADKALEHQLPALEIQRETLGDRHPATLASMQNLSSIYHRLGKFEQSLDLFKNSLATMREVLGDDHPQTLSAINNLGFHYRRTSQYQLAGELFEEALQSRRRLLGDKHPDTLNSIDNMAALFHELGNLPESLRLREEALSGYREVFGLNHALTLRSMNGMGQLLTLMGRYDDAIECLYASLQRHKSIVGNEHSETILALSCLAEAHRANGQLDEALQFAHESLDAHERSMGAEHVGTHRIRITYATILKQLGRFAEAEPILRRALAGYREAFGEDHVATLNAMSNLASLFWAMERFEDSLDIYSESLEVAARVLGEDHPSTIGFFVSIGSSLRSLGRISESQARYAEGLKRYRIALGDEHPYTLKTMTFLGEVHLELKELQVAEPLLKESLAGHEQKLGENHPQTQRARRNWAHLLFLQGNLEQAEKLLLEVAQKIEQRPTSDSVRKSTMKLVVDLYDALHEQHPEMGYDEQAHQWRKKTES